MGLPRCIGRIHRHSYDTNFRILDIIAQLNVLVSNALHLFAFTDVSLHSGVQDQQLLVMRSTLWQDDVRDILNLKMASECKVEPIKEEEERAPEEEGGIGDIAAVTFVYKCSASRGVWLPLLQHSSERKDRPELGIEFDELATGAFGMPIVTVSGTGDGAVDGDEDGDYEKRLLL
ncbi:hypothetical protein Tco_0806507 [Tanacetum coccineum]